ncbi:tetratricopeptide repeat protein [Gallaecimonas pentaromativorans]|uniref:Sel1 repeat-containing protein n=1 Tax=Gallaecimonas pentaromativorans TaxID=584787 RepID=A0A3N1PQZ7_9GAMM|nr:tetratricopeptide repeat protein [Gallaecimonas pentaromativorans]ROQ30639.1 Sel1 repeat-containing protein [Gallaecimonas pentaromativorans]
MSAKNKLNIYLIMSIIVASIFITACSDSSGPENGEAIFEKAVRMQDNVTPGTDEYNQFLSLLEKSSELHYPIAQYRYGEILLKGTGTKKDISKALILLNESKDKEPRSKELLALIYLQESAPGAVPLDTDKGVKLLTESASAGLETSQYLLGTFYLHGDDGIKQDNLQAYYWLRRAAEQNNKVAQLTLARIVGQGFNVPADKKASEEWECIANNQHGFDSFGICEN